MSYFVLGGVERQTGQEGVPLTFLDWCGNDHQGGATNRPLQVMHPDFKEEE